MPYILEAHSQAFVPSPAFRSLQTSPAESLSFHVTAALLSLGIQFEDLKETITDGIWAFINSCGRATENVLTPHSNEDEHVQLADAIRTVNIAVALIGFLDAASAQADFWNATSRLGLIQKLRQVLSEPFLVAVETSLSVIRNSHSEDRDAKEWKRQLRHYNTAGRPLGAMLLQRSFMWLVVASTSLMVASGAELRQAHILDLLMRNEAKLLEDADPAKVPDARAIELHANFATDQMNYLEAGADFVRLGSPSQQKVACAVKSAALVSYLNCSILDENAADSDVLMGWLQETLDDPVQMDDETLASTVLRCMALICRVNSEFASDVSRILPRYIVQAVPNGNTVDIASESLAFVLKRLSKDAVISTLYSLGNVLSPEVDGTVPVQPATLEKVDETAAETFATRKATGSDVELAADDDESTVVYSNVIKAICAIAAARKDEKISALAQSILVQKFDNVNSNVDCQLIAGAARLSLHGGQLEFRSLLKLYSRVCHMGVVAKKEHLLAAVRDGRSHLAASIKRDSPLFEIYWEHLLDSVVALGDAYSQGQAKESEVELAAQEIGQLLHPLAVLMSTNDLAAQPLADDESYALLRDAWFNIVVHGFSSITERGKKHLEDLRLIAVHSPPLVAEHRGEQVESDIELNTVLRRGNSSEREAVQKKLLTELIPGKASDIRSLSYRKSIFLHAAYLVESLRAESGDCTQVLSYYLEPIMRKPEVKSTMDGITSVVMDKYLAKTTGGKDPTFSAQYAAKQLAAIFCSCCHRIERVQQAAFVAADRLLRDVPSALCYRSSLFALLELLSLMWEGCLEAETESYSPRSTFTSKRGNVTVKLSDDYEFRRWTLDSLNRKAKAWVSSSINLAPLDVKGLLQTYLSEFDDKGAYGHISLGRSFALEMGSFVPSSDSRLQSLSRIGDCTINTASDFTAQYTTRQEYRYGETLPDQGTEIMTFMSNRRNPSFSQNSVMESANAATALAYVEARILSKKTTSLDDVRDILRRAAALLCRSERDESAVARYLVSIPFAIFSKQSIKLGASLWLGVINENPALEPKLLNGIAQQWEFTISRKVGLFSASLAHPDPFLLKEKFAPSELEQMAKKRQQVHDMLSPHTRLLHFFISHFNATRLSSPDIQRVFLRMMDLTLDAIKECTPHPMAREVRFSIVLFGLKLLRSSTAIGATAQWRLKDKILSAALSWFRYSPRWSFGSSQLQLKTEVRLLNDILASLKTVSYIGAHSVGTVKSLHAKEQLLQVLLESEQTRLTVWINPLNQQGAYLQPHHPKSVPEASLIPLARTAWFQHPAIAIELATRFHYPRLHSEIRSLILGMPDRAVDEPEAIPLIFGGQLPSDVNSQLKVSHSQIYMLIIY